eukprot:TRINITY_DN55034_c0_g1_i1.p1 TRINITY_DN55034_c0_g1~~TRINITY_DN55034_c0_g1_i1.p1  ORF type:complete len:168 (-),score=34.34 TRINITY_DN55034_c0_g1_i1:172-675(-)
MELAAACRGPSPGLSLGPFPGDSIGGFAQTGLAEDAAFVEQEVAEISAYVRQELRDSVEADVTAACHEVDQLIAMSLRLIPPEIRRLPAKRAFQILDTSAMAAPVVPGDQSAPARVAALEAKLKQGGATLMELEGTMNNLRDMDHETRRSVVGDVMKKAEGFGGTAA